jgi:hypothetical protein
MKNNYPHIWFNYSIHFRKAEIAASRDNGMLILSLAITEWVQVLGLSALLNGVIIASIDYFYKKKAVRNELQLEAMKDKANACSEFCFYLTRMIHNHGFQLHYEDTDLIEQTFADIDEKIKDNFYILDESVRLSWISLRSNWLTEYDEHHVNFVKKAINMNNVAAEVVNNNRHQIEKRIEISIDKIELLKYEDLKNYPIIESLELLHKFVNDAYRTIEDQVALQNLHRELMRALSEILAKAPVNVSDELERYNEQMIEILRTPKQLGDPEIGNLTNSFIKEIRVISGHD